MFHLVTGPVHSGKSRYLLERAREVLRRGKPVWYVVPEQLSYETERTFLENWGVADANKIHIATFTKLYDAVFNASGGKRAPIIDDAAKLLMIMTVIRRNASELKYYGRFSKSPAFADALIGVIDELLQSGTDPEELYEISSRVESDVLADKTRDIALLLSAYRGMLADSYFEPGDLPRRMAERVDRYGLFAGDVFFFDSFDGFTGSEHIFIESVMRVAEEIYISLPVDGMAGEENGLNIFANVREEAEKLFRSAEKYNVKIAETEVFTETDYADPALRKLERVLCEKDESGFTGDASGVTVIEAPNPVEEFDFAAFEIKRLVAGGKYRYKDFAIVARDCKKYTGILESVAKKYSVPVFFDKRRALCDLPICRLLLLALEAARRISTETVLCMLKCGLLPFDEDEIVQTENYCYIWDIESREWNTEWTKNPGGLKAPDGNTPERLKRLNSVRQRVLSVLRPLSENTDKTATGIVKALYSFITGNNIPEALARLTEKLKDAGEFEEAQCQITGYDRLIACFDRFAACDDGEILDYTVFARLFASIASREIVNEVPQRLDSVIFCSSAHARVTDAKVVFMVGVNYGEQPGIGNMHGLFTDDDRKALRSSGLNIRDPFIYGTLDEKFKFYASACAAAERVYFSYSLLNSSMESSAPSPVVSQIEGVFKNRKYRYSMAGNSRFDCMFDKEPAFEKAVLQKGNGNDGSAAALELFSRDRAYRDKIARINGAGELNLSGDTAKLLYGNELNLSASQIEDFYTCPFRYYCEYGLGIKPLARAEINALNRGTLFHYFLEKFIDWHKDDYAEMDETDISEELDRIALDYLGEFGIDLGTMSEEFRESFALLSDKILAIVLDIVNELKNSGFKPAACEVRIGRNADIEPLVAMIDRARVTVSGAIDRVDFAKINADTYIRIIDYKLSGKNLKLDDLVYGMNMQMFIYLASLVNGRNVKPAGVLYKSFKAESGKNGSAVMRSRGIKLEGPDIKKAMDSSGAYISWGKHESEQTVTGGEFVQIFNHVSNMIDLMGRKLYGGTIAAKPLKTEDPCKYCDYRPVCRNESEQNSRERTDDGKAEALKKMTEAAEERRGNGAETERR